MIEEFQLKGEWWVPDNPERKVSGTLKFVPLGGAILDLIGPIEELKPGPIELWQGDIILGFSTTGKQITLFRCFETQRPMSFPGMITSIIHADVVLAGSHFQQPDDISFKTIQIRFSHLDEWVDTSGFTVERQIEGKPSKVKIEHTRPAPIHALTYDDFTISVQFTFTWQPGARTKMNMEQRALIQLETKEAEKSFNEWMKIIRNIQDFLSLGTLAAVFPLSVTGETIPAQTQTGSTETSQRVDVFQPMANMPDLARTLTPFDMLFKMNDISDRLETCLTNWIKKSENLQPVYDYYFSTVYSPRMYVEHRFLNLIGAIEFYHRRTSGGKYQSDEEYESGLYSILVGSIPRDIPSDFRESLKAKMAYLNEYSLRKRLKELLKKYHDVTSTRIKDADKLIEDVVNSRNYLVHQDSRLKDVAESGVELHELCEKLKLLLLVCFLVELDIPSETILALISRNKRLSSV